MGLNTIIDQSAEIKQALLNSKQVIVFNPTSIVYQGEDKTLFRHFSREAIEGMNTLLDNPDHWMPFLPRLVYLLLYPDPNGRPRKQTEIAKILGITKRMVNYYTERYFPEECPRKMLKPV